MANNKKFIGILGGSFDPAQRTLRYIENCFKKLKLKDLLVVTKNPFKNKTFYSLNERVKLAKKYLEHKKFKQFI